MFTKLMLSISEWLYKRFGDKINKGENAENARHASDYKKTGEINLTAIVASKLSNVTVMDSTIQVNGSQVTSHDDNGQKVAGIAANPRAEFLDECVQRCIKKLKIIVTRIFGIGGVILKPWVYNGNIYTDVIEQDRFYVIEKRGDIITSAGIIAEAKLINYSTFIRVEEHTLAPDGTYTIAQKALENGTDGPLTSVEEWASIKPVRTISGVEQMLFAFVKCPTDNRRHVDSVYGVPVTYGSEKLIREIVELLDMFQNEYTRKEAFVGVSSTLLKADKEGRERLPETGLFKLLNVMGNIDDKPFWRIFSPDIRTQAFIDAISFKLGLLEKAVGVNQGVLTDLVTDAATATAIKRSSFDTFSLVDSMRLNLENALEQLVYAYDVLADAFTLAPMGEYEVSFDWDYSLLEDTAERWTQLKDGQYMGVVRAEEARMFLFDEDEATALANLPGTDELIEDAPVDDGATTEEFGTVEDEDDSGDSEVNALLKELSDLAGGL